MCVTYARQQVPTLSHCSSGVRMQDNRRTIVQTAHNGGLHSTVHRMSERTTYDYRKKARLHDGEHRIAAAHI